VGAGEGQITAKQSTLFSTSSSGVSRWFEESAAKGTGQITAKTKYNAQHIK
jgi:hypothetical protein